MAPPPSIPVPTATAAAPAPAKPVVPTAAIVAAMVNSGKNISDLIFSPGKPPQVEVSGHLTVVDIPGVGVMGPEDTSRVAGELIGQNKQALQQLKEDGSADLSY